MQTKRDLWHNDERNVKECIKIAEYLLSNYPNTRFYSLGQSPAWIIKTMDFIFSSMKLISIYNGPITSEFGYIPFSSRFYEKREEQNNEAYFFKNQIISYEYEKNYREILKEIGADPKTIIKKAEKGQKTILLEYTQMGESLASFLSIDLFPNPTFSTHNYKFPQLN